MKLFTITVAAVALSLSTVQASLDWTADSTLKCAQENWIDIKDKCDPLVGTTSSMLPPKMKKKLQELLGDDGLLVPYPSIEQIRQATQVFPTSLFEMFARHGLRACLTPTTTATTETTTTEAAPSSTPIASTSIDWTADSTLKCAQENWADIKDKCDPLISMTSSMLSPKMKKKLQELLGDDGLLISYPSIEQVRQATLVFPTSLFGVAAGRDIKTCLSSNA